MHVCVHTHTYTHSEISTEEGHKCKGVVGDDQELEEGDRDTSITCVCMYVFMYEISHQRPCIR